jgi:hypothetical protein
MNRPELTSPKAESAARVRLATVFCLVVIPVAIVAFAQPALLLPFVPSLVLLVLGISGLAPRRMGQLAVKVLLPCILLAVVIGFSAGWLRIEL